jgi:hypothetical protein
MEKRRDRGQVNWNVQKREEVSVGGQGRGSESAGGKVQQIWCTNSCMIGKNNYSDIYIACQYPNFYEMARFRKYK